MYQHFSIHKDIAFTRARPQKNNNTHDELKNWTHVREVFVFENEQELEIMNVIYKLYVNNLNNFFVPQLKLISKTRIDSKIVKNYDIPKTPYQRLLESESLTMGQKENLKRHHSTLNPIHLKDSINKIFKRLIKIPYESNPTLYGKVS